MMDLKNLKMLIKLMVENDLTEVELQDAKGEKVALKRGRADGPVTMVAAPSYPSLPSPAVAVPAVTGNIPASVPASTVGSGSSAGGQVDENAGLVPINSPMVGTFYASSSPEAKPFVAPGSKVTPDTVVCIIEAMKVFNEIKAETSGTLIKVLVTSGKAVEFGQPLFMIQPD